MLTDDEERATAILNSYLGGTALKPPKFKEKTMISARLSKVALEGLKRIAEQHGYIHDGKGNVTMLLEAIGTGTLEVTQTALLARRRQD